MKHNLFLTMLAAALLGGQVFAETVYRLSTLADGGNISVAPDEEGTIIVDAQKSLGDLSAFFANALTLDYQAGYVLTAYMIDTPDSGVLNITSTVGTMATTWEETFSVKGGNSITLCAGSIDGSHGSVQFLSTDANNKVKLGNTEVMFMGVVSGLETLDMNQVGVVWGSNDITLVGKVQKSVPEPTTGSFSLLALAGLAVRRRRK